MSVKRKICKCAAQGGNEHQRHTPPDCHRIPSVVEVVVADYREYVGTVFEDGDHGDIQSLQGVEGGADHAEKQHVDRKPDADYS